MQTYKVKRGKNRFIIIAICLVLYIGLSTVVGFPLGFGKMMAWGIAEDYCEVVYPQATMEKTAFNPVSNSFETVIYLGAEKLYISTRPNKHAVGDHY